jgi:HD-GYP domain-containing protein (c-di-GMP phosphodiesterase class II)
MLAYARTSGEVVLPQVTPKVITDALARIPTTHFVSMSWARESIARCTTMLGRACNGDRAAVCRWLRDAGAGPHAQPQFSVLCAVGDAIVAAANGACVDAAAVGAFVASIERETLELLASDCRRKDEGALKDPNAAELADALVRIVQLHDPATAEHLAATAALARRIALTMRLPAERVRTIELAARLHDIGNVAIRRQTLRKPGPLDDAQWAEVRTQPEAGAKALADTPTLAFLAPIVRAHRERIDGSGYPDRLGGSEIPLEARVIAVADAFVAMTTERPYRTTKLPNDALAVISAAAGSQFDADAVDAICALLRYTPRAGRRIA